MQIIHKNKNERSVSKGTSTVGIIIYVGGISRHLERKYNERLRKRIFEL